MPKFKLLTPLLIIVTAVISLYTYYNNISWFQYKLSEQHTVNNPKLTLKYDKSDTLATWWDTKTNSRPVSESLALIDNQKVLGVNTAQKRIEIDLTHQKLYAYQGEQKIYDFPISSGLYDWTPRGVFNIWIKLKYTKMSGGSKALGTYYYLPNVPYTMYFSNAEIPAWRGFGIHGAYWHNDFGRPKSHGCVNMKPEDAGQLYYWVDPDLQGKSSIKATPENPGTQIIIYGKYQG